MGARPGRQFEASDDQRANTLRGSKDRVVVITSLGARSGKLQDGVDRATYAVRELLGDPARDEWWARAVSAWRTYPSYQQKTDRLIPLFLLERAE